MNLVTGREAGSVKALHAVLTIAESGPMTTDHAEPERTPDGHHFVIEGRRWRATDPSIPATLRQELVDELMAARRAVRSGDPDARSRVQDAKVALGERGHPWWDDPEGEAFDARTAAAMRALSRKRMNSSICPSDVARTVGGDEWRERMDDVRRVAAALAARGEIVVTQGGVPVRIEHVRGPVRISQPKRPIPFGA